MGYGHELSFGSKNSPYHLNSCEKQLKEEFITFATVVCEKIWHARNAKFYEGSQVYPTIIFMMVNAASKEYYQVEATPINDIAHHATWSPGPSRHLPQSPRQIRIYIDTTFKDGEGTMGVVTRRKNDQILLLVMSLFSANSPFEAELRTLE
ncbi:hypothetical protein PanWU01x14_205840, partial [Parasponia andersonii]